MTPTVASSVGQPLAWYWDLFRVLVERDLKLRYKRSMLGAAWSILNPLAYLLVLDVVFGHLMRLEIPRYTSFLFTGLLAWGWFSSSLSWATNTVLDHRDLVQQPGFPSMLLPVVRITSDLLHFVIALPVLVLFLFLDGGSATATWAFLPVLMGLQFVLTLGPACLVSALQVRFHDTQYLLTILLHLAFFLTPIFYDRSVVPASFLWLLEWNPLACLFAAYRAVLVNGQLPVLHDLFVIAVFALATSPLGVWVFRRGARNFVEEL